MDLKIKAPLNENYFLLRHFISIKRSVPSMGSKIKGQLEGERSCSSNIFVVISNRYNRMG